MPGRHPHVGCAFERVAGGAGGTRTPDIRLAKAALSQLSYGPITAEFRITERINRSAPERNQPMPKAPAVVGHPGLEPGTSVLSGLRSNQLS